MTFPTTSLLDDFSRSDAADLGANWSTAPFFAGDSEVGITSDAANTSGTPNGGGAVWLPDAFTGPCEVWCKFHGPVGAPSLWMYAQHENVGGGATPTGYNLEAERSGGDFVQLTVYNGSSGSGLGAFDLGTPFTDGDGFGLSSDGAGTFTAWAFQSGTWSSLGTFTDSSYTAGDIGLGFDDYDLAPDGITAFGGGFASGGSTDGPGGATIGDAPPAPSDGATVPQLPFVQGLRGLYLQVVDLTGAPIGSPGRPLPVRTPTQPQVTIPLSDSRTASVAVSMYERIAGVIASSTPDSPSKTAQAVIKVLYVNPKGDDVLLINGILMNPESDFDAGVVTCSIHDSTIRLKKRFLGYNHASIILGIGETLDEDGTSYSDAVLTDVGLSEFYGVNSTYGIPLDGFGLRLMLLDTEHGASDWPGGGFDSVPALGIRFGTDVSIDNANQQPAYGDDGIPPEGFAFTGTVTHDSDTITDVSFVGDQTIDDVYEFGALSGPGIADFAQVMSASGTSIVMSQNATEDHTAATLVLEDAVYCQLTRGDCVYDDVTDVVQAQGAFECNWEPIDADHLGPSGAGWEAGQFAELLTTNRVGTDRSQSNTEGHVPVVFVHGMGGFHLTHSPDADSLITYEVQVGPGGPTDPNDVNNKVTRESGAVDVYGIWEDWQQATSAGTGDTAISNQLLANRAAALLTAYQRVPEFVTATIDTDEIGQYCYGTDFFLGDTVTVYAKKGYVEVGPLDVRITQIEVTQVDENGNCQLGLTMVPYLTASADVGGAGDGG